MTNAPEPQPAVEPQLKEAEKKPGTEAPVVKAKADALAAKAPEAPASKDRQAAKEKSAMITNDQLKDLYAQLDQAIKKAPGKEPDLIAKVNYNKPGGGGGNENPPPPPKERVKGN